jgi:hypothetical protein
MVKDSVVACALNKDDKKTNKEDRKYIKVEWKINS